jgi:hypothetical protein
MENKEKNPVLANIAKLIDLKSIMTIIVLSAWTWQFLHGNVSVELYAVTVTAIMSFYFAKPATK